MRHSMHVHGMLSADERGRAWQAGKIARSPRSRRHIMHHRMQDPEGITFS
jgi:hypothetical protein